MSASDQFKLQHFDALINTVTDHLWVIDRNGRYVIANPAFLRSRQLQLAQVLGQTPLQVFPEALGTIYHQADLAAMQSTKPMKREDQIVDAASGESNFVELVKTPIFDEQGVCIGLAGIARDITARRRAEIALERAYAELYELSIRDALTQSYNRRHTLSLAEQALEQGELALLMFDLDHFKQINDQHGHAAGDAVLIEVCQTVSKQLSPDASLGRLGGEEFCVLLPELTLQQGQQCAEAIREEIAGLRIVSNRMEIRPTASFGVSSSAIVSESAERHTRLKSLLGAADAALYRAKGAGRNQVVVAL
jgi:diguanylate cyclase (GGDEF)-like protein/PAS domain S-box-containing protein